MKIALISQAAPPDSAAVGQYVYELARALVARGHEVHLLTSARGYNDTSTCFPLEEVLEGVRIHRVFARPVAKGGIGGRMKSSLAFTGRALWRGLRLGKLDRVVMTTVPPIAGLTALPLARRSRAPLLFWLMDFNPDQAIAMGAVAPAAISVRLLDRLNAAVIKYASAVIALDSQMANRIARYSDASCKTHVIAPWPLSRHLRAVPHDRNPFRTRMGWGDRRVVMLSGNLTSCTPLRTLLEAAVRFESQDGIVFAFVGDGDAVAQIDDYRERFPGAPIERLPYQAISELRFSLSAADVHVVALGNNEVGIRHPSKIYGAMAVERPVLYFGPAQSHIEDILSRDKMGWSVRHGDDERARSVLREIHGLSRAQLNKMGRAAHRVMEAEFAEQALISKLCGLIEESG